MNTQSRFNPLISVAVAAALFTACSSAPTKPAGADVVRSKLSQLQSDSQLATRAPVALKEAELAVRMAEEPRKDVELGQHLVRIADRKVAIAGAQAQTSLEEDLRKMLNDQQQSVRLDARTREADRARGDAKSARVETNAALSEASSARIDAILARSDANAARTDADNARDQTDAARLDTEAARQQSDELQKQITELNAKATDRGLVMTLGDVLFATGQSTLKSGGAKNLNKLVAFLDKYPDRTVIIEGHTDNVGSDGSNQWLSQRRADSVKIYLMNEGISTTRLTASGKGEGSPISGNDSADGRQQNRRVEVIIANPGVSAATVSLR